MQTTIKIISEDNFFENYKPIRNHIDDNASWDGYLYENFGEELEYCHSLSKIENKVWTIIECDDDSSEIDLEDGEEYPITCLRILSGYHIVNSLGFFVTEKPYETDTEIKIDY